MNGFLKSAIGSVLFGVVYLFAAHGKAFFEAMQAGWLLVLRLASDAPLGLTSFLLAVALATASHAFLVRWLPTLRCPLSREFLIESAALAVGVGVMWVQMPTLPSLMLGTLAGLVAPYLYKGVHTAFSLAARALSGREGGPA